MASAVAARACAAVARVTVFHIYIGEDNGQVGEIIPGRDFNFANLDGRTQAFVGFFDKRVYDAVFEDEHGGNQRDGHDQKGGQEI